MNKKNILQTTLLFFIPFLFLEACNNSDTKLKSPTLFQNSIFTSTMSITPTWTITPSSSPFPWLGTIPEEGKMRIGKGSIKDMAISPDGQNLVTGGSSGIFLYKLMGDFLEQNLYENITVGVNSIDWSPNGEMIAANTIENKIIILNSISGEKIKIIENISNPYYGSLSWSPKGDLLAVDGENGINLLNINSGQLVDTIPTNFVFLFSWSPDGKMLLYIDNNILSIWDIFSRKTIEIINSPVERIGCIDWAPDGTKIAYGSDNNSVTIWDVANKKQISVMNEHLKPVSHLEWSPDGNRIASASDDGIIIWDVNNTKSFITLENSEYMKDILIWKKDGKSVLSSNNDNSIIIWDAESGIVQYLHEGISGFLQSIALSTDGKILATAWLFDLLLWSIPNGELIQTLKTNDTPTGGLAWSPENDYLATSDETSVIVWNTSTWEKTIAIENPFGSHSEVISWSPDGAKLAIVWLGPLGCNIIFYDPNTGEELNKVDNSIIGGKVNAIAFSPDGKLLAAGISYGTIALWNVENGNIIGFDKPSNLGVVSVEWSPDGLKFITGSLDGLLFYYNGISGEMINKIKLNAEAGIHALSWSPDGKIIAIGLRDKTILLINALTGEKYLTLLGHANSINGLEILPDGNGLISASKDDTIIIWNISFNKGE